MYEELREIYPNYKAMEKIGEQYGVSRIAVYLHLFPAKKKRYAKRPSAKWENQKDNPVQRERIVSYKRKYQNLRNHIDDAVREAFAETDQDLTMEDISEAIQGQTGISMSPQTICGLVTKYQARTGQPLLVNLQTQPPTYALVPGYE